MARQQSCALRVSKMRYIGITYLRGFAALSVFFLHFNYFLAQTGDVEFLHFGEFGVDIFFVISGFLIAGALLNAKDAKVFLSNRINRVVPLYVFATTVLFLKMILVNGETEFYRYFMSITFFPYTKTDGIMQPLLGVGWTLNFEMMFYSIAAVLYFRVLNIYTLAIALYVIIRPDFYFDFIVIEFLFGIMIWRLKEKITRYSGPLLAVLMIVACTCTIVVSDYFYDPEGIWRLLFWGIPAAFLVAAVLQFRNDCVIGLRIMGDISYSIYIWHYFVIQLITKGLSGSVLLLPLCLGVTLVVSYFSYKVIEQKWRII
jgi:exopolysaccharide production protein ExoZ